MNITKCIALICFVILPVTAHACIQSEESITKSFELWDKDQDSKHSVDEYLAFRKNGLNKNYNEDVERKGFGNTDKNNSGFIERNEFVPFQMLRC